MSAKYMPIFSALQYVSGVQLLTKVPWNLIKEWRAVSNPFIISWQVYGDEGGSRCRQRKIIFQLALVGKFGSELYCNTNTDQTDWPHTCICRKNNEQGET
jgi:hypothetical protein